LPGESYSWLRNEPARLGSNFPKYPLPLQVLVERVGSISVLVNNGRNECAPPHLVSGHEESMTKKFNFIKINEEVEVTKR
jgi:hypothetical protein